MYYMCICENHVYTKLQVLVRLFLHTWINVHKSSEKFLSKASDGIVLRLGIRSFSKNKGCAARLDAHEARALWAKGDGLFQILLLHCSMTC